MQHPGKLLFTRGPSITARLLLVAALSIVLMTVDHRRQHLETVRAALSLLVYPLQYLVNLPMDAGRWLSEGLASRRAILEENARLRAQHLLLEAQLQKLAALEAENMRLRELLHSSLKVGERVLIAELLAVDLDPYKHQVVLNKGRSNGVYRGQPLVDSNGVMGQVIHVGPVSAVAMLITDPSHALPVQVNRSGLRTIAIGTGARDQLELPHVPTNADIHEGDLLVTSGLGGRFPPGYPVAVVEHIERGPGRPFARIHATPTAHLNRSREVLLVWMEDDARGDGRHAAAPASPDAEPARP